MEDRITEDVLQYFSFLIKELREVALVTAFFAAGFNLIPLTTQLVLPDYRVRFGNYMVATILALVVGKSLGNDALMEIFFTGRSSGMTPEPGSPVHQPQDDESRPTLSMSLGRVDCVE
jgi:hypothetical protein